MTTIFACSRNHQDRCKYCGATATVRCCHPVGRQQGNDCGIEMCGRCAVQVGARAYCRPHTRFHLDGSVKTKPVLPTDQPRWIKAQWPTECFSYENQISVGDRVLWWPGKQGV